MYYSIQLIYIQINYKYIFRPIKFKYEFKYEFKFTAEYYNLIEIIYFVRLYENHGTNDIWYLELR